MELSCCLWGLTANQSHQTALAQVAELGFRLIDVQPQTVEPAQVSAAGLRVSCVALSHGAPEDCSLDAEDASSVARALIHVYEALDYASALGATTGYLVPRQGGGGRRGLVSPRAALAGVTHGVEVAPNVEGRHDDRPGFRWSAVRGRVGTGVQGDAVARRDDRRSPGETAGQGQSDREQDRDAHGESLRKGHR